MIHKILYFNTTLKYYDSVKYSEKSTEPPAENPSKTGARAARAIIDALPRHSRVSVKTDGKRLIVELGGQRLGAAWVGEGRLRDIRELLSRSPRPEIVVGRRLSPGARSGLSDAGVGWVDETGAVEIAVGPVIVSRPGRGPQPKRMNRWPRAASCVAEVLLCGTGATVAATHAKTGLSVGSCTRVLRFFADLGLLEADAARGRSSGRRVADRGRLLEAYAQAAQEATEREISVTVGVAWQDAVAGVVEAGRAWDEAGISWAATGTAAAAVLAPVLTHLGQAEVYVDARTVVGLEAVATAAELRPMPAGRLALRPFPTRCTDKLASIHDGMRTAPWPRVYADLRRVGVRGEDAAEHLRSVWDEH